MKSCPLCKLSYPDEKEFCFVDGADLVALVDPRLGSTLIGRYRIDSVLGEGGMATVYGARHLLVERECAVKIMNPMFARDPVVRERFNREAKNTQKLAHPNVIDIFDSGECEDGTPFIAMERLNGMTLASLVEAGPIPVERAMGLMIQMACGIARAHDLDVVHRDLKPENIFVCSRPNGKDLVKILDFGIARALKEERLTSAGEVFGTPQYMAPERITQSDAGPSSDLYSLGIVFYEMLTGKLPFEAREIATFFVKHLKEEPRPMRSKIPTLPGDLDQLVIHMLAKTAEGRPVDVHKVQADLTQIATKLGIEIPIEPIKDEMSSRRAATTLSPMEGGKWQRATELLQKSLNLAYGALPPPDAIRNLGTIRGRVPDIVRLREESIKRQAELEQISERGREGRQRFGFAVDALGQDASKAKSEERAAQEMARPAVEHTAKLRDAYIAVQRDVLRWEGRSGMMLPTEDLLNAYRALVGATGEWLTAYEEEKKVQIVVAAASRAVKDLEFQIRELRQALQAHEKALEEQEMRHQSLVTEASRAVDRAEDDLRRLAEEICAPLRGRSDLETILTDIQRGMAA